jgi:hypothetical protein
MMVGHSDLEATTVYLHLSRRHLQATANPLAQISCLALPPLNREMRIGPNREYDVKIRHFGEFFSRAARG